MSLSEKNKKRAVMIATKAYQQAVKYKDFRVSNDLRKELFDLIVDWTWIVQGDSEEQDNVQ